jgi:hypothetical protein
MWQKKKTLFYMSNSSVTDNDVSVNESILSINVSHDGKLSGGNIQVNNTYKRVYPSKVRMPKGSDGINNDAKRKLVNAIHCLKNTLEKDKYLLWAVIKFDDYPKKQLDSIARLINPCKTKNKSVRDIFKICLDKSGIPYVFIIGIKNDTIHNEKLPYRIPPYDFNVIYVSSNENTDIFEPIVKAINSAIDYRGDTKAKIWIERIDNKSIEEYAKISKYFSCSQVKDKDSFHTIQKWGYPLPDTWHIIQNDLKNRSKMINKKYPNRCVTEVKDIAESLNYKTIKNSKAGYLGELDDEIIDIDSMATDIHNALININD